jgi:hypothetical protein
VAGLAAGGVADAAADVAPRAAMDAAAMAIFLTLMVPPWGGSLRCEIRMRFGRETAGQRR